LLPTGDTAEFPAGFAFFEPLINGAKGMMVLGASLMAAVGAGQALVAGGRPIVAGPAIGYGLFSTVVCWTVALIARRAGQRSGSPLVQADAMSWQVNALISTGVAAVFASILLMRGTRLEPLAPYVDPVLVLVVVAVSIGVPIRMAWQALLELVNRTPSPELLARVRGTIEAALAELPVRALTVRVIQPGRTRMVMAHVVLPVERSTVDLGRLDAIRDAAHAVLASEHAPVQLDMVFTADPRWGAPLGDEATG
jgi:predicted Co/Zn/Cd cation transporter (cation efflux family)